jgi:predicted nucleotidyltransferase
MKELISARTKTALERAMYEYNATNLRIFGSAVRGELTDTSDVDVIVDIKDPPRGRLFARAGLSEELSQIFGRPVDVVFSDDAFVKKLDPGIMVKI